MPSDPRRLPSASPTWRLLTACAQDLRLRVDRGEDVRLGATPDATISACGVALDESRRSMSAEALRLMLQLARDIDLEAHRTALFAGETVNRSEQRAALHPLQRDFGGTACRSAPESLRRAVFLTRDRMRAMAEQLHDGRLVGSTGARITDIVNIGIGGSEFGSRLLCDALQDLAPADNRVHFASNLDGVQIARLLPRLRAESALFIVSSKSFGTIETLLNARSLRRWFDQHAPDARNHWFAVTGKPLAAEAAGIPGANIFDVPEWVGGRFSAWGAVGLPAALYLGWPLFEQWLRGGAAADEHFATAPFERNVPVRMALANVWNATFLQCRSHCIASYDDRLAQLLPWAQQLEMESNGKSVSEHGVAVDYMTAPIVWGGLGNNGQHTYYQLLREGTCPKAVTLIGSKTASSRYPEHAAELGAHFRAQAEALSQPCSTGSFNSLGVCMLDDLDPFHLGALMATLENATVCSGWLWGINSFDQPGVELGKKLAAEGR